MKANLSFTAIWVWAAVILFLILDFIALAVISHPGARLPLLPIN
jgi:hypothetical protein